MKQERNSLIDIARAIAIISIVIGHAYGKIKFDSYTIPIGRFVYTYHLAVWGFFSGYLYNDSKTDIWDFIKRKLQNMYFPFLIYNMLYLLIRPALIYFGFLDATPYSIRSGDYVFQIVNILTFHTAGEVMGPMWFVPFFFFGLVFFAAIRTTSHKIPNPVLRDLFTIGLCVFAGIVGLYSTARNYYLQHNIQLSLLFVPVISLGFYFKRFNGVRLLNPVGFILSFVTLALLVNSGNGVIELSQNMIISKTAFYPVTICGIYFVMSFAKILSKIPRIVPSLAYVGKNSFDIMALHFLVLRIIKVLVQNSGILETDSIFSSHIWLLYYVVGVCLPLPMKAAFLFLKGKWETFYSNLWKSV